MVDFLAQGTGQNTQQKANSHIGGKWSSTKHLQNPSHDTSSKEEEVETELEDSTYGDIAHLTTGMAASLSQFLTLSQRQICAPKYV